jgi:hypothetical protein
VACHRFSSSPTLHPPPARCHLPSVFVTSLPPNHSQLSASNWSYLYTGMLPRLISFVCHSYENTGGVGYSSQNGTQHLQKTGGGASRARSSISGRAQPYFPSSVHSSKFRMLQVLCLPLLRKLPGCGGILPILGLATASLVTLPLTARQVPRSGTRSGRRDASRTHGRRGVRRSKVPLRRHRGRGCGRAA